MIIGHHLYGVYTIRVRNATLVAAIVFVALFWRLGAPTFWDPDEGHYAETTREMVASGDWMAPYYNESPFFDKPALFHQLQAASMVVFGSREFAARLVPALAALVLVGVTGWFGSVAASTRTGLIAALVLVVSPGVFGLARYAILDTVFTAFVFGGAALLAVAALHDRPRLQWPGYICIALAVLTKGPLALVLCGLALAIASAARGDLRRRLFSLRWVRGLLLIVVIAAPWFVYMYLRFRGDFINGYVLDENLRLFASSRFANQPGPLFYVQVLAASLLPWTGLLIGRGIDDIRAVLRGERLDSLETLLWAWTLAVVGFFTASTFKLDHYVFPAAPALCLLCARAWEDIHTQPNGTRHVATRVGAYTAGPLLVATGLLISYLLATRLDLPRSASVVAMVVVACGVSLTTAVARAASGNRVRLPWEGCIALTAIYAGLILFALPSIESTKVAPDLARFIVSRSGANDRVASYRLNRLNPAFRFYVNRHVEFLESPAEAAAFFATPQPFFCVMGRQAYDEFVTRGEPLTAIYRRDGVWATSGRVLRRDRPPPDQFVVVSRAR